MISSINTYKYKLENQNWSLTSEESHSCTSEIWNQLLDLQMRELCCLMWATSKSYRRTERQIYQVLGSGINSDFYEHLFNAKDISKICFYCWMVPRWRQCSGGNKKLANDILRSHCNDKFCPLLWHYPLKKAPAVHTHMFESLFSAMKHL
jgi:hypothetical protein